jgi:hypothetical protein
VFASFDERDVFPTTPLSAGKVAGPVAREKSLFAVTFCWIEGFATLRFAVPRLRDCASANGIAQTVTSRSR